MLSQNSSSIQQRFHVQLQYLLYQKSVAPEAKKSYYRARIIACCRRLRVLKGIEAEVES